MPKPLAAPRLRPFSVALLAVLTALPAVVVLAAVAPSAARIDPGPAFVADITEGTLRWEVRRSFNDYVGAENIAVADGATRDDTGEFVFPVSSGTFDAETGSTELTVDGTVHYAAYCGFFPGWPDDECALDLTLSELRVVIDPTEQTLYAHVRSRPLEAGDEIPPIVDFGEIPLVELGIGDADVALEPATTTWIGIATGLTDDAVPAFQNYPPGAQFAPLAFTYLGPGGEPVLDESWTPPGTPVYEEADRWVNSVAGSTTYGVHVDSEGELAYLVSGPGTPDLAPYVRVVDASTLDAVGAHAPAGLASTQFAGAFDHATGTLYLPEQAGTVERTTTIQALRWDEAAGEVAVEPVATLEAGQTLQTNPVWNPASESLYALVTDSSGAFLLATWSRDDSGWTARTYPLPTRDGWLSYWYTPGSLNDSLAVAGDGSVVLARGNGLVFDDSFSFVLDQPAALRITVDGDAVEVTEIDGTGTSEQVALGASTWAWSQVSSGPDGRIAFTSSDFTATPTTRALLGTDDFSFADHVVLDDGASATVSGAFDAEDGTFWAKSGTSGQLWAVGDDGLRATFMHPDSAQYAAFSVGADHALYSAIRNADRAAGLARLDRVSLSPSVTTHPADVTVEIPAGGSSAAATFTAAADGEPAPSVHWQQRELGSLAFTDIAGATSTELRLDAEPGDNGTEYRAVFTNDAGSLASEPATLTVEADPTTPSPTPSPTPTPSPSPTPTPSASPTDSPTPTPSPTASATGTPSPTPTPTPSSSATPAPSDGPTPSPSKAPNDDGGSLPDTGTSVAIVLVVAVLLALAGLAGTLVRRRMTKN